MGILDVRCPHCGKNRNVDASYYQRSVLCPRCKQTFSVKAALEVKKQLIGQVIEGKYHLRELLREGGFALVYRAEEIATGQVVRPVAVKLIYPDPQTPRTATPPEELAAVLRMSHPNIVSAYSAGICKLCNVTWLYLVMELAEESLEDHIRHSTLDPREAGEFTEHIASALAYLHKDPDRLVHRDVKPANILRFKEGWKLADFGLAFAMERMRNNENQPSGTDKYMPPEGFEGKITPAWDMWAFGVMLTEALTGHHPFESDRHIVYAISQLKPQLPPDLPMPFLEIIRGCLIQKRALRWTAPQVLEALHAAHGLRVSLSAYRWTLNERMRQLTKPQEQRKRGSTR